jgi:hypothetical protein
MLTMRLNLRNSIFMEPENIFNGKGRGVVELDLMVRGRNDQAVAVGCNVKDVDVAMGECRSLFEGERWLDKARFECDGDRGWDSVVHDIES